MARPGYPRAVQMAFWRRVAAGVSTEDAAVAVGVSRPVGYRWFAGSGGVMPARGVRESPPSSPRPQGRRLGPADREEIAHLLRVRTSHEQIAKTIGFATSTVSREIGRNTSGGVYRATTAQKLADQRARAGRQKVAKLVPGTRLHAEVVRRLEHNQRRCQIFCVSGGQ